LGFNQRDYARQRCAQVSKAFSRLSNGRVFP